MKQRMLPILFVLSVGLAGLALPATAGTFTKLNEGDPHRSWAVPRINNEGHVAMIKGTTSAYSGSAWLWTGSWATLSAFTGSSVGNMMFQPRLEMNDLDRIAYTTGGEGVRICDTTGVVTLGAAPTSLNYRIDVNDSSRVAAFSWASTNQNRIYSADAPYSTYTTEVSPQEISPLHLVINNAGQIAWRPSPLTATLYRYTPGIGSEAIGSSDYSPIDMDERGRIIHSRGRNSIMLDNLRLRSSTGVWQSADQYSQSRISDNGRHVVWTEHNGTLWDLWTLVDGIPVNLTQGAYNQVLSPDVNDDGTIVFAEAINMWSSPYVSNVWMYVPTESPPAVYNGHFDGETWFGWDLSVSGSGSFALVPRDGGGFAARLTTGSPVAIEQEVDVPSGSISLAFDFDFLTSSGVLTVSLGGVELAELDASDDTEAGFTHVEIPILTTPPLGEIGAAVVFTADGDAGSIVQVDAIGFESVQTAVPSGPDRLAIALRQAHPNPFRSMMTIEYELDRAGHVEVLVFDARGRCVATLVDERRPEGVGTITWNGADAAGGRVPAGVYFLHLRAGMVTNSRRVILVH
ncbi:MAG: FlgD immunoglobulin-like domain containing protein [Deltaproteobacteria bacterium]|nr:FlgD immunoglobulin-like domain containing protein [Deltaproteobacteria bacterium]